MALGSCDEVQTHLQQTTLLYKLGTTSLQQDSSLSLLEIVLHGQALKPGDNLISSDTAGHAIKDPGTYTDSHIVAKIAETVDWDKVSGTALALFARSVRGKKLSVPRLCRL